MKNIQLGDLFAFPTALGEAYLQFVYADPQDGEFVRVLPGTYQTPLSSEEAISISKGPEAYIVGFTMNAAYKGGLVRFIAHGSVTDFKMPTHMRTEHFVRGEMLGWHIVELSTMNRNLVKDLGVNDKKLSPHEIWNPAMLKERIENGWTLENWC